MKHKENMPPLPLVVNWVAKYLFDEGIPFLEAQIKCKLSNFLNNSIPNELNKFLPLELDEFALGV
ncbi:unnamed protein product, partial [Prunus brigantina]